MICKLVSNQKTAAIFLSVIMLFLIPAVLARVFYHHQNWLPKHTLNHGQLISPPMSIKDLQLDTGMTQHRWVLLFLQSGDCQLNCQKALYHMQQIQRALGKDMNRLQRAVITSSAQTPDKLLQDWLTAGTSHWQVSTEDFTSFNNRHGFWYVCDPLGNIILNYSEDANPEAILDDLKYLMGVSNIG